VQELRDEKKAAVSRKARAELDVQELQDRIHNNSRTQVGSPFSQNLCL
jgi:hypothetical protein